MALRRGRTGRPASPSQSRPSQSSPSRIAVDRRLGRALAVGVLDAQQQLAAGAARIEPVEQRRARSADMQEAGRRRGEAGDDGLGHIERVALAGRVRWSAPCSTKGGRVSLRCGLGARVGIWHKASPRRRHTRRQSWTSGMASGNAAIGEKPIAEGGQDFIRDIVAADLAAGRHDDGRDPLSARAERLPAYRPRQVDLPQFRRRARSSAAAATCASTTPTRPRKSRNISTRSSATCAGSASTGASTCITRRIISSSSTAGPST